MKISKQRTLQKNESLTPKEADCTESDGRKIIWEVQGCRPNAAFDVIELSMKFKDGTVGNLQRAIKVMKKI